MIDTQKEKITNLLSKIRTPDGKNLITSGILKDILIDNKKVFVTLVAENRSEANKMEKLGIECKKIIKSLKLFDEVEVIFSNPQNTELSKKTNLQIKNIFAISSAKGGVGKSTIATNLAVSAARMGNKVGLLDADIYGPSQPKLMGIKEKPKLNKDKTIEPIEKYGVKIISIGFMVAEENPLIWRGPMIQSALYQLISDVNWSNLDILFIDMPPGTGDVHLTITQKVNLSGAIVVSTPQDIALIDANKGINMFKRVNVPILGIIENMSMYICPKCGNIDHIFGLDGALNLAKKTGTKILGQIPLSKDIMKSSDKGKPISIEDSNSKISLIYQNIITKLNIS